MGKTDPRTKSTTTKGECSGRVFERVFLPWMAILILSYLLTIYVAPAYMWGVHFYHFFPAWIGWTLVLASLVILIPGVGESIYPKFEAPARRIRKPFDSLGRNKSFFMLSFLSLPIFWIFRSKLHLLGDGYFRIRDLPEGKLYPQEWLDGFVHLVVYRVMIKLVPTWTPEITYSAISVLCGGVFVFLALKLSSLVGNSGFGRVLIFFFLVSSGSIQLFFGYVESYTILQVTLLGYILFAAMYLAGKVSILPVLLTFVISVGLHITSLIFVPSFIYLLLKRQKHAREDKMGPGSKGASVPRASGGEPRVDSMRNGEATNTPSSASILAALILALVVVCIWIFIVATGLEKTGRGIFILPLKGTESFPFGMFSLAHISEFLNQLFLLSPLSISLIVFFIFFKLKFREFEDGLTNFLALGVSFGLIYLFVFNFYLGSADWDLRSSPAPLFSLLGVHLFLRWAEKHEEEKLEPEKDLMVSPPRWNRLKAWGLIFIWFGLFHTLPWVLLNTHHQRSVDRYQLIQENDRHPMDESGYNLYKIERILRLAGLPEEVPKMYRRAIDRDPGDPRSYCNLAGYYEEEDFYKAISLLQTALKVDPSYFRANRMMGYLYLQRKEYAKAIPYLEQALPFLTDNPDFVYDLGLAYYLTDQPQRALTSARLIVESKPDYLKAYYLLGTVSASVGDFEQAWQAWERVLAINPGDSLAAQSLKELERHPQK